MIKMPIYEFLHPVTGEIFEVLRSFKPVLSSITDTRTAIFSSIKAVFINTRSDAPLYFKAFIRKFERTILLEIFKIDRTKHSFFCYLISVFKI